MNPIIVTLRDGEPSKLFRLYMLSQINMPHLEPILEPMTCEIFAVLLRHQIHPAHFKSCEGSCSAHCDPPLSHQVITLLACSHKFGRSRNVWVQAMDLKHRRRGCTHQQRLRCQPTYGRPNRRHRKRVTSGGNCLAVAVQS